MSIETAQLIAEREEAYTYAIVHARKVVEFHDAAMLIKGMEHRSSQEERTALAPIFEPMYIILSKDVKEQLAIFSRYYNQFKFIEAKLQSTRLVK